MTQAIPSKLRVLAAAAVVLALASAGIFSTQAYFNDEIEGTYSVSTATAELKIKHGSSFVDTVPASDETNWVPGDTDRLNAKLCNRGSSDLHIQMNVTRSGSTQFANVLEFRGWVPGVLNGETKTLTELTEAPADSGADVLAAGACETFRFDIEFPDDGNQNHLQNKTASAEIVIEGRTSEF